MTAGRQDSARLDNDELLGPVLRAAHEIWIRETRGFLEPIMKPDAPFWDRWTAVRYLADHFLGQYHRERALVDELRPFLPPHLAESLPRDGERIGQLQGELDQVGRRRATAPTVSGLSRELLQSLRSWCAEIETAAGRIPRHVLPEEGARLVTGLEQYTRTHA